MDDVLKYTGSSEEEEKLKKDITTLYNDVTQAWGKLWGDHIHHGFYDPKDSYTDNDHKTAQVRMVEEALKFAQITDDNKPKNILDIGCGLGGGTMYLANKFEAKACGIDLSPVQIQKAQEVAKADGIDDKVSFQVADASNQPFPDGQFDLVWSMESAEKIPNKLKFVSEMARVAAPGATIIITSGFHRELLPDEVALKLDEKVLLDKIRRSFCLSEFCSASDFVKISQSFGLQEIKTADWTDNVAPFWPAVVKSCWTLPGLIKVIQGGWKAIKEAFAMKLMVEGYDKKILRYVIITCRKPK